MREITKKYTIYNIDDVMQNKDLKQIVLEKHSDINVDYEWYENILEDWQEKLTNYGFIYPKIYFTGFYHQGDGVSFIYEYIDIKKMAIHSKLFTNREINALYALWYNGYIKSYIKKITYRYCHPLIVSHELYDTRMPLKWPHLQELVNRLRAYINELIVTLSDTIYEQLQAEYEYLTSDKAILDTLEANDYEFYEDGTIAA